MISAGGTREELDPVRFLGNWSSGPQGYALAATAAARGARVTLVAANVELPDPAGARVIRVVSARDLSDAVTAAAAGADAIVMAAAVADFRPAARSAQKIKKRGAAPDADRPGREPGRAPRPGAAVRPAAPGPTAPGPARSSWGSPRRPATCWPTAGPSWPPRAATCWWSTRSGAGWPSAPADNEAVVLSAGGPEVKVPRGPKEALADVVWDLVAARLAAG